MNLFSEVIICPRVCVGFAFHVSSLSLWLQSL